MPRKKCVVLSAQKLPSSGLCIARCYRASLCVLNLLFLLPLGIIDANKQRCDAAKGMWNCRWIELELLAPGLKSSCSEQAISKAKETLSCLQAGRQETSDVGSLIMSTVTISNSQAWGIPGWPSLCWCISFFGWLPLWATQNPQMTHSACSLFWTAVYPQEKMDKLMMIASSQSFP